MPSYDFHCPECDLMIEQSFAIFADPVINCAKCGVKMIKQFSATPAHFKGDGWAGKTK